MVSQVWQYTVTSTSHSNWEEKLWFPQIYPNPWYQLTKYEYAIKVEGRKNKWYLRNVLINSAAALGSRTAL